MLYALPGDAYMGVHRFYASTVETDQESIMRGMPVCAFAVIHTIHTQHLTCKNTWGDAYIECSALRFLIDVAAAVTGGAVAHTSLNSTSLSLESESTRLLT